jgi:hypothetical protein
LFCSKGSQRAALFYTLIRTATLNGVEREAWLHDVIARIGAIIGSIVAAAYTLFKWGKALGKTEGVVEGERAARSTIEEMRLVRDDAIHDCRTARGEVKSLRDHIEVVTSRTPELDPKIKKLLEIRDAIAGDDVPLWRIHQPKPLPHYNELMRTMALRVITVANEKGGVGKTTTVANLAGFFDKKLKKRGFPLSINAIIERRMASAPLGSLAISRRATVIIRWTDNGWAVGQGCREDYCLQSHL